MSDEKIKVFKLAKQYGFKSADFVEILRKVGFSVSSYQASLDAWDVPVIEERLVKGGLLDPSLATSLEDPGVPDEEEEESAFKVVVGTPTPPPAEEEEEEKEEQTPPPTEELAPEDATAEPDAVEKEEDSSVPEEAAAEPTASETTEPPPEDPQEDGAATPAAKETLTPAPDVPSADPSKGPVPKPRAGAKLVGKIDLAALGLVKARHNQQKGKVTFTDIRNRETSRRRDQRMRQRELQKSRRGTERQVSTVARKTEVVLQHPVTPKSFSAATGIGVNKIMGKLMGLGLMPTVNTEMDGETIELLAAEFEIGIRLKEKDDVEVALMAEIQSARKDVDETDLTTRPPVIAFMGHVDHGKTSLIDRIRDTKVAQKEAGGITQHLGAYTVETKSGKKLTILDTPGHAAFTAMRARGSQTTDIAILVVAADDGVMPQTEEAANHAKEAGVPVIVAINKVDVPGANPDKVKAELASLGLQSEEWGGTTGMVETSALRGTGIEDLLERVILEAEVLELKAHPNSQAAGIVLEALVSEGRGKVTHVLVQNGTLRAGDAVLCGSSHGKVRRLYDQDGKVVKSAGPSTPVQLLGLNTLPEAADLFFVVRDQKAAKEVSEKRALLEREAELARGSVSEEQFMEQIEESRRENIRLVVKADVGGTLEVLKSSLQSYSNDDVSVSFVHTGVGAITETDVSLAATAGAIVIGFNVAPDSKARKSAEQQRIKILRHSVIYELTEEIERMVLSKMGPEIIEEVSGKAEVLQLFRSSRWGFIAGCSVVEGVIRNSSHIRIIRNEKVLHTGIVDSLRHVKDDVREVKGGSECGIKVSGFDEVEVGDIFQAFDRREILPTAIPDASPETASTGD